MVINLSTAKHVASYRHRETTFSECSIQFEDLSSITAKNRYSSSIFEDGHRKKSNCRGFGNLFIYDVDNDRDDKLPLSEAVVMFQDIPSLIVTTKSHQREKNGVIEDRYRIILPVDQHPSIMVDDYSGLYMHVASLLGIEVVIDTACKDVARMYQPNPNQEVYYSAGSINPLSMEVLEQSFFAQKELEELAHRKNIYRQMGAPVFSGDKGTYLRSIMFRDRLLEVLKYEERFVAGGRNTFLYATGCYLLENGLSTDEVKSALAWINSLRMSLSQHELETTIYRSLKL